MGKKIQVDEKKEAKIWETKFGEKTSVIEIGDKNCRNEFTGQKLLEEN